MLYNTRVQQGDQLKICALNSTGERLEIPDLKFYIIVNGESYNRKTNSFGLALMDINLNYGDYSTTVGISGLEGFNFIMHVYKKDVNLTAYGTSLNQGDVFHIKLTDNGIPLPNRKVTISVNGVSYHRTTNSIGEAGLTINLPPQTYDITYAYDGSLDERGYFNLSKHSILVVKSPNSNLILTSFYVYSLILSPDGFTFELISSSTNRPIGNKVVKLTINGVSYTGTTNSYGTVRIHAGGYQPGLHSAVLDFEGDSTYKSSSAYYLIYATNNLSSHFNTESTDLLNNYTTAYSNYCNFHDSSIISLYNDITASCSNTLERVVACYYYATKMAHEDYSTVVQNIMHLLQFKL